MLIVLFLLHEIVPREEIEFFEWKQGIFREIPDWTVKFADR